MQGEKESFVQTHHQEKEDQGKCRPTAEWVRDLEVRDVGMAKVVNALFISVLRGKAIPGH